MSELVERLGSTNRWLALAVPLLLLLLLRWEKLSHPFEANKLRARILATESARTKAERRSLVVVVAACGVLFDGTSTT